MENWNKTYRLNEKFLRELDQESKKAFALSLIIKANFENSRVYNYNPTSLSTKIKVSRYSIAKYVPLIRQLGWGYYTSTEFVMKSFRHIVKRRRLKRFDILISHDDTIASVVDKLNFIILKNNIKLQEKVSLCRSYYVKSKRTDQSVNHYKKIVKGFDPKSYSEEYTEQAVIGIRKLSDLLKCSTDYASKFLKRMVEHGLIKIKEICKLVMKNVSSCKHASGFGYYFCYKNKLYHHVGTNILLLL